MRNAPKKAESKYNLGGYWLSNDSFMTSFSGAPFNRRQVDFVCKVECDPICAVSWFRNGVPIEFDERRSSNNDSETLAGPHHYVVKSHAEVLRRF